MTNRTNRQWLMTSRPEQLVSRDNFTWTETEVPDVQDGQMLVANLYMSLDPTLRAWMNERDTYVSAIKIGETMRATTVAQVVESKHPDFKPGEFVIGGHGWQDYCVTDGKGIVPTRHIVPGVGLTAPLSVLGLTGITAYFGILDIGRIQEGETVVVSGAAGATGSIVGQIARIKGCKVIGIAGGGEKCAWLTDKAGFHHAIDYKNQDVGDMLSEYCPDGIDVYFDNVGGPMLDEVLARIAMNARIVLCGAISGYNNEAPPYGPKLYSNLIIKRGTMQGFIVLDFAKRYGEAVQHLAGWIQEGKIVYQEDIQEGLENAPETFQRIFTGKNQGKQLLKIADPPIAG